MNLLLRCEKKLAPKPACVGLIYPSFFLQGVHYTRVIENAGVVDSKKNFFLKKLPALSLCLAVRAPIVEPRALRAPVLIKI